MTTAYHQLYFGLIGAIVPVYLVIVVNFLSWLRTAKPIDDWRWTPWKSPAK